MNGTIKINQTSIYGNLSPNFRLHLNDPMKEHLFGLNTLAPWTFLGWGKYILYLGATLQVRKNSTRHGNRAILHNPKQVHHKGMYSPETGE